jgi:hypothetical protein
MVRSAQETRPTRASSSGPPRIPAHRRPLRRRSRRDGPPDCVRNQQLVLVRGSEPQRSPPPAAKTPPTSAQPSYAHPHRGRPDQQPPADLDPRARTRSVAGPRGVGGRQSRFCRPASAGCWHVGARWPVPAARATTRRRRRQRACPPDGPGRSPHAEAVRGPGRRSATGSGITDPDGEVPSARSGAPSVHPGAAGEVDPGGEEAGNTRAARARRRPSAGTPAREGGRATPPARAPRPGRCGSRGGCPRPGASSCSSGREAKSGPSFLRKCAERLGVRAGARHRSQPRQPTGRVAEMTTTAWVP